MNINLLLRNLNTSYTSNRTFSVGYARWGWRPPHFPLYSNINL